MTVEEMVDEAIARQVIGYVFVGAEAEADKYQLHWSTWGNFITLFNYKMFERPVLTNIVTSEITAVSV